jgi:hypothetical protein
MLVFPNVGDKYPYGYSIPLVWRFRLFSLSYWCIFWATMGIGGGWLVKRLATKSSPEAEWNPLGDPKLEFSASAR